MSVKPKNMLRNLWSLDRFSTPDLVLIALVAGLGIATKPVIAPLTHMITGPLFIPGGALAGGLYMMWLILAGSLVGKRGSATLAALIQGIIVIVSGAYGSHGVASILTYTLPGLSVDLLWLLLRGRGQKSYECFFAGIAANISGTFLSNLLFFRLPLAPLLFMFSVAALSGGIGGLMAWQIRLRLRLLLIGKSRHYDKNKE